MRSEAGPAWAKPRWVAQLSVLAGGVLLLAACGSSPANSANGGVAHLGTTTTSKGTTSKGSSAEDNSTPADASSGSSGVPGPGGSPGPGMAMADPGASQSQLLAFARCMQTHGEPNFPEPNAQGVFSGSGVNNDAPGFRAASNDCSHLLPNGGRPTAAQEQQAVAQVLEFSRCMRSHGIGDYPDPQISDGGADISMRLRGGRGSDLDPNNPASRLLNRPARAARAGLSVAPSSRPVQALNDERDLSRR